MHYSLSTIVSVFECMEDSLPLWSIYNETKHIKLVLYFCIISTIFHLPFSDCFYLFNVTVDNLCVVFIWWSHCKEIHVVWISLKNLRTWTYWCSQNPHAAFFLIWLMNYIRVRPKNESTDGNSVDVSSIFCYITFDIFVHL